VSTITIPIDTRTLDGYKMFVQCKRLPSYTVKKNFIETDELSYNYVFGEKARSIVEHKKHSIEFDYQSYVVSRALEREKYAAFLDCGLGKTIIELLFAHDVVNTIGGRALIWCPLSVMEDIQRECVRLYGYRMSNLRHSEWHTPVAILNYESMRPLDMRGVSAVVLDESSILKSGDGETCRYLTDHSINVRFRLACSATPSPNDQTEYASHAVWLGVSKSLKEFYSRFFVKDGTDWRMKAHAKDAFYDFLRAWCCYIQSPSSIGFERGAELCNEPNYIIQNSYPTAEYYQEGKFLAGSVDLAFSRKIFGQLRCDKQQDRFKLAVGSIADKRAIVWCSRNAEEESFRSVLKCPVINGATSIEKRIEIVDAFKTGEIRHIVSKPSVLGFGVNIQEAEAHLYSGYTFSFESFYQAIRRSHRYGRTGTLDVIVPVTEPEYPVWDLLQRKLNTFRRDVAELQSRFFGERAL
jgi:hypothetical protein